MKNNIKALRLVEMGFSSKTILKLSESQINTLYSKLMKEQTGVTNSKKEIDVTTISQSAAKQGVNIGNNTLKMAPNGNIEIRGGGETKESSEFIESEEKNKKKSNPWAICTAQVGRKNKEKYERCVKDVKKSLREGKNPVSLFLEEEIDRIVKKHIPPKITKKDLIQFMFEQNPATAPTKPKERPTTKPGKPDKSPGEKPKNPMRRPGDQPNPSPKASSKKNVSPEQAKDEVIDLIINLLEK